jgi:hypothetical protein
MVTQKEAKAYYEEVRHSGTIYVWGFNYNTIIDKDSIDKAYRDYHSATYDRAYYDKKLKEGFGKPGSDCSGQHYLLSGYDTTAQGYFDKCPERGTIDTLPLHDCVLLFRGQSDKSLKHTGTYYGNGMCEHMKSSKENCVYESVDKHGWTHWGKPTWISYDEPLGDKPILTRVLKIKMGGIDVKLLQERLNELGYDCGKVDGDYGQKTYSAVKHFQNDNNIAVDGIVAKQTCKKLKFLWRGPSY